MGRDEIHKLTLGATMIVIGIAPAVLFLLRAVPGIVFVSNVGGGTDQLVFDNLVVQLVLSGFGLFLAAMGVFIIRYGQPESPGQDLY
ncbi:hypothetical protein [Halomicrococcus gelatinilyticus]|uniref:hypothetical protein n=1 Tax=Halomicrococcus gelatinilyticus TaxID=1702103 RepID=UPI002E167988